MRRHIFRGVLPGFVIIDRSQFLRVRRLIAEAGAFVLSGSTAVLRTSRRIAAESGAFSLTGADVTLRKGVGIAAESGSFALTGNPAALRLERRIVAGTGSFTITGQHATLTYLALGNRILLSGDMQSGTDKLLLSGDEQDTGTDAEKFTP